MKDLLIILLIVFSIYKSLYVGLQTRNYARPI